MERGEPMTTRPQFDERDPLPPRDWEPASHEWARRAAIDAAASAVRAAKDARKPAEIRNATEEKCSDE